MSERRDEGDPHADASRRARIAEVFGEVLPETTDDERDPDVRPDDGGDAWLRAQVPPHHG